MTTAGTTFGRGAAETAARRRRRTGVAVASALCVLGAGPLAVAATAAAGPSPALVASDGTETPAPAAPTLALTPMSGANHNSPRLAVTAEAGTTLSVSGTSCDGTALLFTGPVEEYPAVGVELSVPDDSTTTVYA